MSEVPAASVVQTVQMLERLLSEKTGVEIVDVKPRSLLIKLNGRKVMIGAQQADRAGPTQSGVFDGAKAKLCATCNHYHRPEDPHL